MEGNTIPVRVKSGHPARIASNGFGFINAGNLFTNPKVTRHYGPVTLTGSERCAQQYELQSGVDTNPYEAPSKSPTVSNQESMEQPPTVETRTDDDRSPGSGRRPSCKPASEKPTLEAIRVQDLRTRPLQNVEDIGAPNTERRRLMRYEEHAI